MASITVKADQRPVTVRVTSTIVRTVPTEDVKGPSSQASEETAIAKGKSKTFKLTEGQSLSVSDA